MLNIIGYIIAFVAGYSLNLYLCYRWYTKKNKKDYYINCLKNALLTNALIKHNSKDINQMIDYNFKEYDGRKLPHLSGCDYSNICFSYIQPDYTNYNEFSNKVMDQKEEAIYKYLHKNFNTTKDVNQFFDKVIQENNSEK